MIGHRSGRRAGHAAAPADQDHQQAPAAGLRQADDLLPDPDAGQRRHRRHPARHRRQQRGRLPAAAGQRQGVRPHAPQLHLPGGRGRHRRGAARWPSTSPTATSIVRHPGRQHHRGRHHAASSRPSARQEQRRQDPAQGGRTTRERFGVAELDGRPRRRHRGEAASSPRADLRRDRHLHVRRPGLRHHPDAQALGPRRARDHRRQQRLHRSAAR